MIVIDFIKKFGWVKAKDAISVACEDLDHVAYKNYGLLISDLRLYVNAYDLVNRHGGLNSAKKLNYDEFRSDNAWGALQQAIVRVEKCQ